MTCTLNIPVLNMTELLAEVQENFFPVCPQISSRLAMTHNLE